MTLPMSAHHAGDARFRVLVVDPAKEAAALLKRELGEMAAVERAATADTALQTLALQQFNLLVLQLKLPLFSGLELAYKLKRIRPELALIGLVPASDDEDGGKLCNFGYPPPVVFPMDQLELVERSREMLLGEMWLQQAIAIKAELRKNYSFDKLLSLAPVMQTLHQRLKRIVGSRAPVLATGESGTGKELVARMVHQTGDRVRKPFITVNCAAVPEGLLESQFFGHEKGAFTGAVGRAKGKFELAHTGTLFLDEVGELSPALQAKLLRVLEYCEFERVGGNETLKVDVRLITATNRNLEQMVAAGTFRPDLYYRINVFPIHLPPLRDRGDDVILLAYHFLAAASLRNNRQVRAIAPDALELLKSYPWPGNIRELENAIERAILLSDGVRLRAEDFPTQADWCAANGQVNLEESRTEENPPSESAEELLTLAEAEKIAVRRALEAAGGNVSLAAKKLGIARGTLYAKMEEHGIASHGERAGDRPRHE